MKTTEEIVTHLQSLSNPHNVAGMARFGIHADKTLGVSIPVLRDVAKKIGKNHTLAGELWKTGIHEARILASMIEVVEAVAGKQMDEWTRDFDSWDVCDQVCFNVFWKKKEAFEKAQEWTSHNPEFERRAGFALMASLAVHDKKASDTQFLPFLPLIERYATDDRNFVKKAVNWALRQIGKRNRNLCTHALKLSETLKNSENKSARWIGMDAFRELHQRITNIDL